MIFAIDGPAASGKSTSAKLLADKLKFLYLDTGAMHLYIAPVSKYRKFSLSANNLADVLFPEAAGPSIAIII